MTNPILPTKIRELRYFCERIALADSKLTDLKEIISELRNYNIIVNDNKAIMNFISEMHKNIELDLRRLNKVFLYYQQREAIEKQKFYNTQAGKRYRKLKKI